MATKTKIVLPKVAPYFPDDMQDAGQRVDTVLSRLQSDLTNFKAPDTSSVDGVDGSAVTAQARNLFYQTFESDIETYWTLHEGSATGVSYPNNGRAGGRALRSSGEVWYSFPENIPFDPDRLYRIRARVRMVTAPADPAKDLVKVGVMGVAADRTTLVNTAGANLYTSQHEVCMSDLDMGSVTLGDWEVRTGYFKGSAAAPTGGTPATNSASPATIHEDARYFRPFFALNFDDGDGVMEIDYIVIEVLTETPEVDELLSDVGGRTPTEVGSTVRSGGGVAANQVYPDSLQVDSVTANKIKAGEVNATHIASISLSVLTAAVGQLSELTDDAGIIVSGKLQNAAGTQFLDLDASGADPFLKTVDLEITAAGAATFSGALSAATGTFSGSLSAASGTFTGNLTAAGGTFSGTLQADSVEIRDSGATLKGELDAGTASKLILRASGTNDLVLSPGNLLVLDNFTAYGSAGSIARYIEVEHNSTVYKIALYSFS